MKNIDLNQPQRENKLAMLFSAALFLRTLFSFVWPLIVAYVLKGDSSIFSDYRTYLVLLALLIVSALHGFLSWKNYYFYIKNDEFVVEKGYLKKSIIALPLEKIVSINTDQKILHQILGVVAVKVDATGTTREEVKIKAVKKEYALALEGALGDMMTQNTQTPSQSVEKKQSRTIVALSPLQLLKISIARNHLQGLALLLVFINRIHSQFQEFFREEVDMAFLENTGAFEQFNLVIWLAMFAFIVVLSVVISIIRTFLSYYGLQLLRVKEAFLLGSGLLKRKKITIPFSRVQAIQTSTNPLQRILKIATVRLVQASSEIQTKNTERVLIPGCSKQQTDAIKTAVLQTSEEDSIILKPHWALRNRIFFRNIFITLPVVGIAFYFPWVWTVVALLFLLIAIFAYVAHSRQRYMMNRGQLYIKKGSIVYAETFLEEYRLQAVCLSQNFFQRRRNTASLHLGLAGINVSLDYIPYEQAVKIKDFLLCHVIESKQDWL